MGGLKAGHLVEAALWLFLAAFLYARSFAFDKEIEIYKFGATAWPRAVLLLIVIAAAGQLFYHWREKPEPARPGDVGDAGDTISRIDLRWHTYTFSLLALPLIYLLLPGWIHAALPALSLHAVKLACAGGLLALYLAVIRGNPVGAMLALPVFFGVLMNDIGFYFLAPFFIAGVMWLMGERRVGWVALVTAFIMGVLLLLFVSVLYVGLPIGNISPFYEIGAGVVGLLQ